jgi:hypothetical protein
VRDGFVFEAGSDAFVGLGELVVIERRRHQTLFGERERDARRIARDPTSAPLLRDKGGRARTARDV